MKRPRLATPCLVTLCGLSVALAGGAAVADVPEDRYALSDKPVTYLSQNWTPEESIDFYAVRQGSPIIRKEFFDALEQPDGGGLFRDNAYLASFGFLPQQRHEKNPDGYPIGFVADTAIEINCAACHTSKVTHGDVEYRIDGSAAITDIGSWLAELVRALELTLADGPTDGELGSGGASAPFELDQQTKFGRFARRVLRDQFPEAGKVYLLKELLRSDYERRKRYNDLNDRGGDPAAAAHAPYGFGRLDALNAILNQATAEVIDAPDNAHAADAPVNYPAIWDAPQHKFVQWNGSVDNERFARFGALARNAGQVVGVFGIVDARNNQVTGYDSSIRVNELRRAENLVTTLWSPEWPFGLDPEERAQVPQGRELYVSHCLSCHADMDRRDPSRRANEELIPIHAPWDGLPALATDELTAKRFAEREARVALLAGRRKTIPFAGSFPNDPDARVASRDILAHVVFNTLSQRALRPFRDELTIEDTVNRYMVVEASDESFDPLMVYKSRPLNGVWSTAPYLHNGSVLNMAELLKPAADRLATFRVGSTEYDPATMGFVNDGPSELDTSVEGNRNTGHEYGAGLSDAEKEALIAYLKTL